MKETILYAFWTTTSYDYIRILSGEIKEFFDDGSVAIKGYTGFKIHPFLILNEVGGKNVKEELEHIHISYLQEKDKLREKYYESIDKLVGSSYRGDK